MLGFGSGSRGHVCVGAHERGLKLLDTKNKEEQRKGPESAGLTKVSVNERGGEGKDVTSLCGADDFFIVEHLGLSRCVHVCVCVSLLAFIQV